MIHVGEPDRVYYRCHLIEGRAAALINGAIRKRPIVARGTRPRRYGINEGSRSLLLSRAYRDPWILEMKEGGDMAGDKTDRR